MRCSSEDCTRVNARREILIQDHTKPSSISGVRKVTSLTDARRIAQGEQVPTIASLPHVCL
jgi:hypothetical protein